MTQLEQRYLESQPTRMMEIVNTLKSINKTLKELSIILDGRGSSDNKEED